jgi:hypothetical protein
MTHMYLQISYTTEQAFKTRDLWRSMGLFAEEWQAHEENAIVGRSSG